MASDSSLLPVTNLMSVSRVLYDKAMVALMQENAALKLQLFWKDHNVEKLKDAMIIANEGTGPHCKCIACVISGRKSETDTSYDSICTFKPWFENHLSALGIQTATAVYDGTFETHMSGNGIENDPEHIVFDHDSHLCHISRDDWFMFTYGAKLWKAKSVDDPELQKLKSLFAILHQESPADEDND